MVLEKDHDRVARWDHDTNRWSILDRVIYRWCDLKGNSISDWYVKLGDALEFAINRTQDKVNAGSVTSTKEP
jgi:hypothetical protein